jgi:hypothetical protein
MGLHLIAAPLVAAAIASGTWAWRRAKAVDRWAALVILLLGAVLYTPPSEHIPLFGDAAIYPNSGALIARTGGISTVYEPLAVLSPEARAPFFVSSEEQLKWIDVRSYAGLVYGAYYITDLSIPTIRTSRPPLAESWFAFTTLLAGVRASLYLTPIFATLSLVVLYALGKVAFGRQAAVWGVALLAVSYPQIHFARSPYAEAFGQLFVMAGFYFAVRWLRQRNPWQMVSAILFWLTAWSARVDAVLLLGSLGLLLLYAASQREWRTLRGMIIAAPLFAGLAALGTNAPYVGATLELLTTGWPWVVDLFWALLITMLVALPLLWWGGHSSRTAIVRIRPPVFGILTFLLAAIVLWSTVPNPLRSAGVTYPYQEIVWFSSQYVTPLLYLLAVAGFGLGLRSGASESHVFLSLSWVILGAVLFSRYTSAPVYPVSLRRLTTDVFPLTALLAGMALSGNRLRGHWRILPSLIAALTIVWMLGLSWPVIAQREAQGSLQVVENLHRWLPPRSVLVFEVQDDDSWVGWLAAPLYSIYGDQAILLDSDEPDPRLLARAVSEYESADLSVFLVSQQSAAPAALIPPGYRAVEVARMSWKSTLIGQTRAPYPPPYWEFDHPVYLYALVRSP